MNYFIEEVFSNEPLVATGIAWFLAQLLKTLISTIREGKFDFKWFVLPGGFPSSHSAAATALATSLGIKFGFSSGLFALSVLLAGFIIFDARVIRRATGKQAETLNRIVRDLYKEKKLKIGRLKEFLGHTSLEIFFGILLGIIVGFYLSS